MYLPLGDSCSLLLALSLEKCQGSPWARGTRLSPLLRAWCQTQSSTAWLDFSHKHFVSLSAWQPFAVTWDLMWWWIVIHMPWVNSTSCLPLDSRISDFRPILGSRHPRVKFQGKLGQGQSTFICRGGGEGGRKLSLIEEKVSPFYVCRGNMSTRFSSGPGQKI